MNIHRSLIAEDTRDKGYITLAVIHKFCRQNDIRIHQDKVEQVNELLQAVTPQNYVAVNEFIERALFQGHKVIRRYHIETKNPDNTVIEARNPEFTRRVLSDVLREDDFTSFCDYVDTGAYIEASPYIRVMNYELVENNNEITSIQMRFVAYVNREMRTNGVGRIRLEHYPIHVEIRPVDGTVMVRGSARNNLSVAEWVDGTWTANTNNTVEITTILSDVYSYVKRTLHLVDRDVRQVFQTMLSNALVEFTPTPQRITEHVENKSGFIRETAMSLYRSIFTGMSDDEIKRKDTYEVCEADLKIFFEKHYSINSPSSLFTDDREAYPIGIRIHDRELSRVNAKSGNKEPIQTKAVFFDNKRASTFDQSCSALTMVFQRNAYEGEHAGNERRQLYVTIKQESRYCAYEFHAYTLEEDIQYVLSTIENHLAQQEI